MKITLYKFGKKRNSTKRPDGDGLTFDFNFLNNSSMLNPVIGLSSDVQLWEYNYAHIDTLKRFYFVTDWTSRGNIWSCSLSVDVLASWKEEIGNSTQYVERSSATFNGTVADGLYPATSEIRKELSTPVDGKLPYVRDIEKGTYIIGIINGDRNALGAVSYYAFTHAEFKAFSSQLMNSFNIFQPSMAEISADLGKMLFNPFQYIASCVWLPFSFTQGQTVNKIPFGWWSIDSVTCKAIKVNGITHAIRYKIPKHPQSYRGSYMNCAPFSNYRFVYPAVGSFVLDSELLKDEEYLTVEISTDIVTGKACAYVHGGYWALSTILATSMCQIGVPVQMAMATTDIIGAVGSAINTAGGALSLDMDAIGSSIINVAKSLTPTLQTSGSNGTTSVFDFLPYLESNFSILVEDDPANHGRPLMRNIQISKIPGYIKTVKAIISFATVDEESQAIISAMNGGFYYE